MISFILGLAAVILGLAAGAYIALIVDGVRRRKEQRKRHIMERIRGY